MEAARDAPAPSIDAGNTLSIIAPAGWTLVFERGSAWLTLEGYSQDKFMQGGQRFTVPSAGLMLIEASSASRVRLEPPPPGMLSRLSARLGGRGTRILRALLGTTLLARERMSGGRAG